MEKVELSNIKLFGEPDIQYRRFPKNATIKQVLEIIKKPFITTKNVILSFKLNSEVYYFPIQSGFMYDGATIIKLLVPLIGLGTDIRFMKAALIHDYFLDHKSEIYPLYFKDKLSINGFIKLTTFLFKEILRQNYVSKIKSSIMAFCVGEWQKSIFNKKMWRVLNNA